MSFEFLNQQVINVTVPNVNPQLVVSVLPSTTVTVTNPPTTLQQTLSSNSPVVEVLSPPKFNILPPTPLDSTPVVVVQGPTGPRGPAGGTTFSYSQTTPSANWIISHNLGRHPSVVLNIDGERVLTDVYDVSVNEISIMFASPKTGIVELS